MNYGYQKGDRVRVVDRDVYANKTAIVESVTGYRVTVRFDHNGVILVYNINDIELYEQEQDKP